MRPPKPLKVKAEQRRLEQSERGERGGLEALQEQRVVPSSASGQARSYYVDWRMLRDVKRRKMAYEYADERLRINSLRKNTILPKHLQEVADEEIAALPRDSCPVRIRNRCVMTSRPRGVKRRWRLSRIVFRHLADHGQLSGIQRAIW
uniref:Mitochondrial ribosomal protein S14 n=1 Tax=Ovis aries TaxID=9940 RepID=A0AC11EQM9_SHEEP